MCPICGVLSILDIKDDPKKMRDQALVQVKRLRHRGPDWNGIYADDDVVMAHERLSIVDVDSGEQPLFSDDGQIILCVNGEIYNHQKIRKDFEGQYNFLTQSDCEIIIPLYLKYGNDCVKYLNGIFAFVLYDKRDKSYLTSFGQIK